MFKLVLTGGAGLGHLARIKSSLGLCAVVGRCRIAASPA
ncbi:hypothetical protein ABIE13_002287 [Ottowia thiooxydans]|uniref:Uncharacterized protein n=1 Tax=Ottowia thiooxydans TaxID=219182 RepID=A0ABV2Q808_9BURK